MEREHMSGRQAALRVGALLPVQSRRSPGTEPTGEALTEAVPEFAERPVAFAGAGHDQGRA